MIGPSSGHSHIQITTGLRKGIRKVERCRHNKRLRDVRDETEPFGPLPFNDELKQLARTFQQVAHIQILKYRRHQGRIWDSLECHLTQPHFSSEFRINKSPRDRICCDDLEDAIPSTPQVIKLHSLFILADGPGTSCSLEGVGLPAVS